MKITRTKIHISLADIAFTRLEEMCKHYGFSYSVMVQKTIEICYKDYIKERGGYFAGADSLHRKDKKERQQEIMDMLTNAPATEAIAYLWEIGSYPKDTNDGFNIVKFRFEGDGTARQLFRIHENLDGKETYRGNVYASMEGLFKEMRSEKKL